MSFNLREFIKNGLLLAVGNKPDYEVILSSASWLEKRCITRNRPCRNSGKD